MLNVFMLTTLLIFWFAGSSSADIFKCRQPDGTFEFTDRSSSADCTLEKMNDLPVLGVAPATVSSPAAAPTVGDSSSISSGGTGAKTYEDFKNEASRLVEEFTNIRHDTMHGIVANKLQARREAAAIRAQKSTMIGEIQQSSLDSAEKRELTELLGAITE